MERILLRTCDITILAAHVQTKQGYASGFHLALSFPRAPPLSLEKSGRRRKRAVAELQELGALSHPISKLSTTAPLVGDWAGVCLFLFLPFPPFARDPLFLLTPYQRLFALQPSSGRSWERQQEEFTRRIMSKSPACSHFT